MRSHTLNAAPSSEYPWTSTIGLRGIGANIRAVRDPVLYPWKLYICSDEADAADKTADAAADAARTADVAPSTAGLRHVTGGIPEARLCRDRLDSGLPRRARKMARAVRGPAGRCAPCPPTIAARAG